MIDSHCHLQFNAYKDDAEKVIARCREKKMIMNVVGTQRDTSAAAVELAEKYPEIYATVGLHPVHTTSTEVDEEEVKFTSREEEFDYEFYKKLASHPKVIAIGECGIELFHLPADADREAIVTKHRESFLQQAKLAQELGLPMVIHVRDAYEEMISLISTTRNEEEKSFRPQSHEVKSSHLIHSDDSSKDFSSADANRLPRNYPISGVIHCYTGDWPTGQKFLDLGLYLGFTAVITFPPRKTNPKADLDLKEVVEQCPLDKMLIETDAPYLAPQKYRGERCEPWMVEEVAAKIGEIRGLTTEEVVKITEKNARRLFTRIA